MTWPASKRPEDDGYLDERLHNILVMEYKLRNIIMLSEKEISRDSYSDDLDPDNK